MTRQTVKNMNKDKENINTASPDEVVNLIFLHHSCGKNLLDDESGRLGLLLAENNYFVSDTYYNWGPDKIGSKTDVGHWWTWFRGPDSSKYMQAVYNEKGIGPSEWKFTRLEEGKKGENEVVLFKSCYPNSKFKGNISDSIPDISSNSLKDNNCSSEYHAVSNAKGIYIDILEYFRERQDKLFIVLTAPPVQDAKYADNARHFNNWLVNEWLKDYPYHNVGVFDFFNVLTSNNGSIHMSDVNKKDGNHHRILNNRIEHVTEENSSILKYPSSNNDTHPNTVGNLKASSEFIHLLNVYYNKWKIHS
jgi:hypothetical protein